MGEPRPDRPLGTRSSGPPPGISYGRRSKEDITFSSRYECKYLISPLVLPALRQFIDPFMTPDPYAAVHEGFRYPICSLYLDSIDLALYQQTVNGEKNRFKLRVRTYCDDPDHPVFFEVKRKINNIVRKQRARVSRSQATQLLDGARADVLRALTGGIKEDAEFFVNRCDLTGARPIVRVKYFREAYESRSADPVRLTLDTDLMHAVTLNNDLTHQQGRWTATPVNSVILEIKFTDNFPTWVTNLVRSFALVQTAVPKYIMSLDHMLLAGREAPLALAGFVLPPRRA